jgi:hypothetical protein
MGGFMLGRYDLEPLLEITSAENIEVRLAGLDAITRFPLTEDAWRSVGPAMRRVLADTAQGSPGREEAIELAARAPLTSVRSELVAISEAADDPDADVVRGVLRLFSPADVERLLQRLENDPTDSGAAGGLAALPVESLVDDDRLRSALTGRLRDLARSSAPDVGFWASLALARLGDMRALDEVLGGRGEEPGVFWGSPWTAYDRLAELRPIPDALRAHLMDWLEKHPEPPRNPGILAWALTGSADAQGLPIQATGDDTVIFSATAVEPEKPTVKTKHSGWRRRSKTTRLVERAVADLLAGESPDESAASGSLTAEQSADVLMHVLRRLAGEEAGTASEVQAAQRFLGFGNRLVDFAATLPTPTELPVREIYRLQPRADITARQKAWILSRSSAPHLIGQFGQDLPDMEPREQIDALQMLGDVGDFLRGAPAPYTGAGPGDATPPVVPATLLDDVPAGLSQPDGADDTTLEGTSTAWPHLDAPPAVAVSQPFDVEVGLGERRDPALDGTGALALPAAGFTLGVELLIDGFAIMGDRTFTLDVTAENRYPKRKVTLIAVADATLAQRRRIGVVFRVGHEMRGYAGREVVVTATPAQAVTVQAATGGVPGAIDTSPFTAPDAADLTVIIQRGDASDGSRLVWSVASRHMLNSLPADPRGPLVDPPPERFLEELVGEASSDDILDLFASLRGQGRADIARLMPVFVRDALRSVGRTVAPRRPTVLLLSQDPYVPWELAVLDPPLPGWPSDGSPFLGAQAAIGRWVLAIEPPPAIDPPKHVTVHNEVVVTGVYDEVPDWPRLESAEHEAAELRRRWPSAYAVDASLPAVLDCIAGTPAADIIHFALHGEFSTETARQGVVLIGTVEGHPDQRRPVFLKPSHVDGGKLARSPLVFLNACQVGANRLVLGNYSGMASAFVRVGASAVVAPLWSVNDEAASAIALDFYARVFDGGEPPAEVLRANRAKVTDSAIEDHDGGVSGTQLAYQFFGHPNLRLAVAVATQAGKQ